MDYSDRLRRSDWEVRLVYLEVATAIVERFHYAHGGSNTATYLHGLYRLGDIFDYQCQGIAWWIPPTKSAALATYPKNWEGVLCLSRLVILPDVPKNACSFLLARSMKLIDRHRWPCLVSYADEWQGHHGTIYLATNWQYVGNTVPESTFVRDGRMVARKAGPTTRTKQEMIDMGCDLVGKFAKRKFVHIDDTSR